MPRSVIVVINLVLMVLLGIALYLTFVAEAQTLTVVVYEREVEIVATVGGTDLILIPSEEADFLAIDLSRVTGMSVERTIVFETLGGEVRLPVGVQVEERLRIVRNEALVEVEPTLVPTPPAISEPIVVEVLGLRAEKVGGEVFLYLTDASRGLAGFAFMVTGSIVLFNVPEWGLVNQSGNEVTAVDLNGLVEAGSGEVLLFSVVVEIPGPTVPGPGVLVFAPAAVDDDDGNPIEVETLRIDF